MTLWEINNKIQNCFALSETEIVDGETGEIFDATYLDELEMARDEKIENICKFIKNLDADAKALKEQKMIFADKQRRAENKRDSLKAYLSSYLDGEKWVAKDRSVSVSWRKSESVEILDETLIDDEWIINKPQIDRAGIKKAIKLGEDIAGATLTESVNIQVK